MSSVATSNARLATIRPSGNAVGRSRSRGDLLAGQRPEVSEQVVELIGRSDLPLLGQPLQFQLHIGDDRDVEELSELRLAANRYIAANEHGLTFC